VRTWRRASGRRREAQQRARTLQHEHLVPPYRHRQHPATKTTIMYVAPFFYDDTFQNMDNNHFYYILCSSLFRKSTMRSLFLFIPCESLIEVREICGGCSVTSRFRLGERSRKLTNVRKRPVVGKVAKFIISAAFAIISTHSIPKRD
jgi:hypothetical protein